MVAADSTGANVVQGMRRFQRSCPSRQSRLIKVNRPLKTCRNMNYFGPIVTASGMMRTVGLTVGQPKSEMQEMAAKYLLLLALALAAPASLAQGVAPDALLRAVTWPTSQ